MYTVEKNYTPVKIKKETFFCFLFFEKEEAILRQKHYNNGNVCLPHRCKPTDILKCARCKIVESECGTFDNM